MSIDGLPFTSEGYERAKNILKTNYGKPSEVANAHTQQIISLPTMQGSQPSKIHEFYENLVTNTQALETMGKIKDINGYVRVTLDKLPGIRADLVRLDEDWQNWGFPQMIEALRKWCDRNPVHNLVIEIKCALRNGKLSHPEISSSKPKQGNINRDLASTVRLWSIDLLIVRR